MEKISIQIPANSIYIKSIRLFSASLASDLGFDIEKVEDARVVISEALNYKLGGEDIKINFYVGEKELRIEVIGKDRDLDKRALQMRDLILEELSDKCQISDDKIDLSLRTK
ncbi:MAG: anti-sigma regulatory factor [Anaerococcus sp.]|nr:anti-sigma regulatory factor [Anaerococcus sp.]